MKSHPTWVRGLKLTESMFNTSAVVAPYVGAWIETENVLVIPIAEQSHPTWVRGLKL